MERLADVLAAADARVVGAVTGMIDAGEQRWAAYPILRSALWQPMADRHSADARSAVLQGMSWGAEGVRGRAAAARKLVGGLTELIKEGVAALPGRSARHEMSPRDAVVRSGFSLCSALPDQPPWR